MSLKNIFCFLCCLIFTWYFLFSPKLALAADVLINEFLPNPPSGFPEWVEFYNTTNATLDLSDYYFDDDTSFDSDSGSSAKIALSGLLPSLQTCFWELSSYLNNNGDSPTLFKIASTTALDTYSYSSSSAGISYSRVPDGGGWATLQQPTKSSSKCIDLAPTATPTPMPTNTPIPTNTPAPTSSPTPMKTPTPTPSPTKVPTPTLISTTDEILSTESSDLSSLEVLGESASKTPTLTLIKKQTKEIKSSENNLPKILIGIGSIFLISCGILAFYNYKKKSRGKFKNTSMI